MKFSFLILMFFALEQLPAQDNLDLSQKIGKIDSTNIFVSKDYYIWCSSVVKGDDQKYHLFYSRWKHGVRTDTDDSLNYIFNGFKGWNKYSEIAYAVSDHLTGPYKPVSTVLKGTGDTSRWDRFTYHNPLIRYYDGFYYLYFISNAFDSSFTLAKPVAKEYLQWLKYNCTQKIGVIKAKTIEDLVSGHYAQPIKCIMAPDNKQTFEVATNPAVTQGPDGKFYMMYKSRLPNVGHMTFWMAVADKPDGPFKTISSVLSSAEMACEDPTLWYDKKRRQFYAVAKYFSNAKVLAPEFGALVLITSKNGVDWQPAKHPVVSLKELTYKNGTTIKLANLERPFIVTDAAGQPVALFAAAAIKSPFEQTTSEVGAEHNSFNVQISLR
ncbi:MAG: glycoside hydrolase family protein [Chitinophagaceae bacterium]|nr:glycoside hydrolase family protein [Chitinophagaceae bacterium]